jgi:hypothetical protein
MEARKRYPSWPRRVNIDGVNKRPMRNWAGVTQSERGRLSVRIAHARVGASWGLKALLKFQSSKASPATLTLAPDRDQEL